MPPSELCRKPMQVLHLNAVDMYGILFLQLLQAKSEEATGLPQTMQVSGNGIDST